MSLALSPSTNSAPGDRLWEAVWSMEVFIHDAPNANPHHPDEKIGVAYPHASGGTLTYELDFRRDPINEIYLPRIDTQLLAAMMINGQEVDMVLGGEKITLSDDDSAIVECPVPIPAPNAVLIMAVRMEAMLRMMQSERPDAQWWVDQGSVFWGS